MNTVSELMPTSRMHQSSIQKPKRSRRKAEEQVLDFTGIYTANVITCSHVQSHAKPPSAKHSTISSLLPNWVFMQKYLHVQMNDSHNTLTCMKPYLAASSRSVKKSRPQARALHLHNWPFRPPHASRLRAGRGGGRGRPAGAERRGRGRLGAGCGCRESSPGGSGGCRSAGWGGEAGARSSGPGGARGAYRARVDLLWRMASVRGERALKRVEPTMRST